ncbi:MAG: CBS domain-containing protein [Elusimicrobiota bacterium]
MLAKDIMRKKVITVASWLTLPELSKVFEEHAITGAPVVDEGGLVLGVVSQTDLVRSRREASDGVPLYHRELDEPLSSLGLHFEEAPQTRVEQIMTPGAISFDLETPVEKLATAMLERHIHRVLITRGGQLAGIVTSMDLLRALVVLAKKPKVAARTHARRH